jgi:hypothetical protein
MRNALVLRGAGVWVFTRLAAGFLRIGDPNAVQEIFILGVVAAAVVLDARRRREDLFLANLGVGLPAMVAWALPLALILELLVP